jgi:serine/threonine protein phosphatase 1
MSNRRFVIPDIHGCARTFSRLLRDVIQLRKADRLYLLGDMIDRGPRSREVLDAILQLRAEGYNIYPLRGNHEEMFLQSCRDRSYFRLWMLNGGQSTLDSFGVEDGCEILLSYRQFIESLPYFILLDDFVLVHGSLNFRIPDPFTDTEAMLWSRDTSVDKRLIGGRRMVGGHTPRTREEIIRTLATDRIMLDNGCVYLGEGGLGSLAALELDSMTVSFQENVEVELEIK